MVSRALFGYYGMLWVKCLLSPVHTKNDNFKDNYKDNSVPLSLLLWCGLCYSLILRTIFRTVSLYRFLYSYRAWCERTIRVIYCYLVLLVVARVLF